MKKLALLLTVCLLAWSAFAGCQTQDTPQPPEPSGSEASASSTAQEGDPVVLCIEDSFEQDAYELENYLKTTGVETEYEFLVLPNNTEDRETELTRLRTEIMAGEGPDAFILNATIPGYVTDLSTMEPREALFPNVEKSMYSHLFLDLEDMAQSSEIIDLESCNQTVMDVGVTGDGRFLLPLTYPFSGIMVDRSALEDPDYTFSTLDQLLQSDQETLKGLFSYSTLGMFPNCLGLLADYQGQNLLVTSESLQTAIEQGESFAAYQDEQYSGSTARLGGLAASWSDWMNLPYEETAYNVYPIPNPEGGVTAAVTMYAAINRNASHPQEAFALIEQLFREELVTQAGYEVNGYHYCTTFHFGNSGGYMAALPVQDQLLLDYIEPNTQEATMASLRAAVERIDSAKVYSDLDLDIYDLYETWHFSYGQLDTPLEELVEQTISSMEMTLAE